MAQREIQDRISALRYEGGEVRHAAFEVLVKIGAPAVPALIEALKDEDNDVRQVAAWALIKIGDPAVPALIKVLKGKNERSDVRQVVTWVLTRIGGPAVPALIEALKGQDESVQHATSIVSAEPEETIIEREAEGTVLPRPKLQVEDLFMKAQSRGRLTRPHRMSVVPFGIAELKVSPTQVHPGEIVTISFKVANNSDVDSYYPVTLRINGEVVDAEVVSLPRRTTLPLRFDTVGTLPGDYKVEVNDLAGKFTVIGKELKGKIKEPVVLRPEASDLAAGNRPGRVGVETALQQKKALNVNVVRESGGIQSAIDKVADYIEFGLDKMGDGIAFPIKKMIDVSTAAFKSEDKKAKRQH